MERLPRGSAGLPAGKGRKVALASEAISRARTQWSRISGRVIGAWPFVTCELTVDQVKKGVYPSYNRIARAMHAPVLVAPVL